MLLVFCCRSFASLSLDKRADLNSCWWTEDPSWEQKHQLSSAVTVNSVCFVWRKDDRESISSVQKVKLSESPKINRILARFYYLSSYLQFFINHLVNLTNITFISCFNKKWGKILFYYLYLSVVFIYVFMLLHIVPKLKIWKERKSLLFCGSEGQ